MHPWMVKAGVQFVLAHIPYGEQVNHLLQRWKGRHSPSAVAMTVKNYAARVRALDQHKSMEHAVVLEIGTGWTPHSALLFYLLGASKIHTYDHVRHLRPSLVKLVVESMTAQATEIADIIGRPHDLVLGRLRALRAHDDMDALLAAAGICYHAPGDAGASGLADCSVDLIYSYAVLEHVSQDVLDRITKESKRVLKSDGIAYHGIGIHDHYAGPHVSKVNFLRYPEWAWRLVIQNKISYHNRMRECQFLDTFRTHGARFERVWSETDPADLAQVRTMKVDHQFASFTPEELAVTHTEVIMTFGGGTQVEPVLLAGRASPGVDSN